jgi:hypothetical protein
VREARVEALRQQNLKGQPDFVLDVAFTPAAGDTVRTAVASTRWLSAQLQPGDVVMVQYPGSRPTLARLAASQPETLKLYAPAGMALLLVLLAFPRLRSLGHRDALPGQRWWAAALALAGLAVTGAAFPQFSAEGRRQALFQSYTEGQRADMRLLRLRYHHPDGAATATFRVLSDGYVPPAPFNLRQRLSPEEYAYLFALLRRNGSVLLRQAAWFPRFKPEQAEWQRHTEAEYEASWGYWPAVLLLFGGAALLTLGLLRSWEAWRPADSDAY